MTKLTLPALTPHRREVLTAVRDGQLEATGAGRLLLGGGNVDRDLDTFADCDWVRFYPNRNYPQITNAGLARLRLPAEQVPADELDPRTGQVRVPEEIDRGAPRDRAADMDRATVLTGAADTIGKALAEEATGDTDPNVGPLLRQAAARIAMRLWHEGRLCAPPADRP